MFEKSHEPLAPLATFYWRLFLSFCIWLSIIIGALAIGMIGFAFFENMTLIDALLNSAMILTTMGPVGPYVTSGGKLFAVIYALFSGLVFITLMGVIFAPVLHRFIHKFNSKDE